MVVGLGGGPWVLEDEGGALSLTRRRQRPPVGRLAYTQSGSVQAWQFGSVRAEKPRVG